MIEYLNGNKLYGNDFSLEQIKQWYLEESEGYAELGNSNAKTYKYGYDLLNKKYGFDKLKVSEFGNVLGMGSAWGHEFQPIISKINKLTIIEPSDNLVSQKIGNLKPIYIKPNIDGSLELDSNSYDLITCFGTLHHIPNVSYVLSEMIRVLKPNGYLLIREPIISMGDWRKNRKGLTKNERGIPVSFFDSEFSKYPMGIISKKYCFTGTSLFMKAFGKFLKKPIFSYNLYIFFDSFLSSILKNNVHYLSNRKLDKVAPSSIFYVLKKLD